MRKLKILKKSNFLENLSKIIVKVMKKASILNKNLISVTCRAGCLISIRRVIRCSGKSSVGGSATFLKKHFYEVKVLKLKFENVLYIQILIRVHF